MPAAGGGSRQGRSHEKPKVAAQGDAKRLFLKHFGLGKTIDESITLAGRTRTTYEAWRSTDPAFKDEVEFLKSRRAGGARKDTGEFATFCDTYLHQQVFRHQQQWTDLIEGRRPRHIHPAMTYEGARRELAIVNCPPEHAKTTTITINYVTYRICQDPNVRIIVVSKTKEMAVKFVYAIKNRLTHPRYRKLQADFGPESGYAASADTWRTDMIYLGTEARDSGEKDPTLLALGIGGQIYGARADLIILDDTVTLANAHEYEKQIEWIQQEVLTRLSDTGMLLIAGTRVAPADLYSEIRDPDRYADGLSPWTYFAQPAVLEFGDAPEDWTTLWPQTNEGDRLITKWDGRALHRRRAVVSPRTWALAYQQHQVQEDAVFDAAKVRGCVNGSRARGRIPQGVNGCRPQGMDGLYIVAGLDPAMTGFTAAVVLGVDRATRRRYVLDVHNQAGMTPASIRDLIYRWTADYAIAEWRIEKNAFQGMLTQDEQVRTYLNDRGCVLKEHFTGNNKWDADFGVASMATLFDGWDHKPERLSLLELPSAATQGGEVIKQFIEQLITWYPETKGKTDIVMALWFAEIRAREITNSLQGQFFQRNPYASPRAKEARMVINLDDAFQTQYYQRA